MMVHQSTQDQIRIFTVEEVADILKVSARTVKRLISRQQLIAVHVGRRLRITQAQLDAYLAQASISP